jgi:hypothetical protein
LTLVVIPLLYYVAYRHEYSASLSFTSKETP